jgi:hypothetical protein
MGTGLGTGEQFSVLSSQFSVLGSRFSAKILCHSDDARSADEESGVCSEQETSRFLVALLLGMTRALGNWAEKGQKKGAKRNGRGIFPRPCFQEVRTDRFVKPGPGRSIRRELPERGL